VPDLLKHDMSRAPNFRLFWLAMILLILGTLLLRFDNGKVDICITSAFYNAELPAGERFFLANEMPWYWLKQNDDSFTVALMVILLFLLAVGLVNQKYRPCIRYSFFGLTSMIIGPGLLVNVLLKGYWGRPRPSQTVLWPDSETPDNLPFYKVWDPAFLDGLDKASFPCGHASIVVVYVILFYIFKHPETIAYITDSQHAWQIKLFFFAKYSGLVIGFIGGGIMGFARIVQGAHHASDVLWTFGIVLLVNWSLYYYVFRIPGWENNLQMKKNRE